MLHALEFPVKGSCSVWFIPVYSCLLCIAGDLTAVHALTRAHAHTDDGIHTNTHIKESAGRK